LLRRSVLFLDGFNMSTFSISMAICNMLGMGFGSYMLGVEKSTDEGGPVAVTMAWIIIILNFFSLLLFIVNTGLSGLKGV
jgi:hypothetical protein